MKRLLAHHARLIEESAISPEVADARGYFSAESKTEVAALGFSRSQCLVPALVIPIWNVHGERANYLVRPDTPRVKDGRALKYEIPAGSRMVLDVPPGARDRLGDPREPLFITEGARKADAAVSAGLCCVSLIGVWAWRGTNEHGGKTLLPDFEAIAFNDRQVYVVFDSDVMVKESVHAALERFVPVLKQRAATVSLVYLPTGEGGTKVGLDDFLAAGKSVDDLLALAQREVQPLPSTTSEQTEYEQTDSGLVWNRHGDGRTVPLTNFCARIVADVTRDDGAESRRYFEIETQHRGRKSRFLVPACEFDSLTWVSEHVGAGAVVAPGYQLKEHTRVAIQLVSQDPPRRFSYAHLGWRQIDGEWVFLHAGGGLSATGEIPGVDVQAEDTLANFVLPDPPDGDELRNAIRASMSILTAVPAEVGFPLFAATYRAPLGPCAYALHLTGSTGLGKSAYTALAQQHFGAQMDGLNLPGSWTSTPNYLEGLLYAAKDVLIVVDDLTLGASRRDAEQAQRLAERIYRAQGNQQGRGRMRADSTLRPTKYPRGLTIGTSEDLPGGQSLRARVLVLEFGPDTVDWDALTALQEQAAAGLFAHAMAGYVRWLAVDYGRRRAELPRLVDQLRRRAHECKHHRRTPVAVANLAVGLNSFLDFAEHAGAISREERSVFAEKGWHAMGAAAAAQLPHQVDADLPSRFLSLLGSAITGGNAHLCHAQTGKDPDFPDRWGWTQVPAGMNDTAWKAQGRCVGWIESDHLYLDLDLALGAAQRVAGELGQHLAITPTTLAKQLHERRLLRDTELDARRTYKVRRMINQQRLPVLHLALSALDRPSSRAGPTSPTSDPTSADPHDDMADEAPGRTGRVDEHHNPTPDESSATNPTRECEQLPLPEPDHADQRAAPACPYPGHRPSDWISTAGHRICGTCHPPATPSVVEAQTTTVDPNEAPR